MRIPLQLCKPEFRFILVQPNWKRPLEKDWQNTNNYSFENLKLREHIKNGGNYGVLTGKGNLIVLDFDSFEAWEEWKDKLPKTFAVKTANKQLVHLYYFTETPENFPVKDKNEKTLLDVKGIGGQVVGAGSKITKEEYERQEKKVWQHEDTEKYYEIYKDIEIAWLPKEILEELKKQRQTKTDIKKIVEQGVQEGSRNNDLFKLACSLKSRGISKDIVLAEIQSVNSKSKNPLPQQEVNSIINSAFNYSNETEDKTEIDYKLDIFNWKEGDKGFRVLIGVNPFKTARYILQKYKIITLDSKTPQILIYTDGYYKKGGENQIKKELQRIADRYLKINDVNETIGHIQRTTFVNLKDIDTNSDLISVGNGLLNLKTLKLQPHDPNILTIQKINWNYNSSATCPKIQAFLQEILKDENDNVKQEDYLTIQEWLGFCLYKKYSIKKALILVGKKDTGKTQFLNILVKLLGAENISTESLHKIVKDKYSAANLYGKLANTYDDLSSDDLRDVGQFKIVTGGGEVRAERKFEDAFHFINYAKLIFATNKVNGLTEKEDKESYYGRWLIIFFENQFGTEKRPIIPNISEKITTKEEMEGLLVWALEGLQRLFQTNEFSNEKTWEEIQDIMEKHSDYTTKFIKECLERSDGNWISKEELYNGYKKWIEQMQGSCLTKENLGRKINKIPYVESGQRRIKDINGKEIRIDVWNNLLPVSSVRGYFSITSTKKNTYNNDKIHNIIGEFSRARNENLSTDTPDIFEEVKEEYLEEEE